MSQFADIIAQLEAEAKKAWEAAEAEGLKVVQELETVAEDGFAAAVKEWGALASKLCIQFMQEEYAALTGAEKQSEVVTNLVQSAEVQGKALAIHDAQALGKNAYLAVVGTAPG